jgi:hypothetical protein
MDISQISLAEARKCLEDLAGVRLESLHSPDVVSCACREVYPFSWLPTPSPAMYDDQQVDDRIGLSDSLARCGGPVWTVMDSAFSADSVPSVKAEDYKDFVKDCLRLHKIMFFDGDVILWSRREIWLFHHEGVYASIKLS